MNKTFVTLLASLCLVATGGTAFSQTARARIPDTPIRGEANLTSAIIAVLHEGDSVEVVDSHVDSQGSWYRVLVPGSQSKPRVGYVLAHLIEIVGVGATPTRLESGPALPTSRPSQGFEIPPTMEQIRPQPRKNTEREEALKANVDALRAKMEALQNASAEPEPQPVREPTVTRIVATGPFHAQHLRNGPKQTLGEQDRKDAVFIGLKEKGKLTGLSLTESGRAFGNAPVNANDRHSATAGVGVSLRLYTPTTWVEQQASNAAKEYRPFVISDITEEMLESVLRVMVYPDKPTRMTGAGMAAASSVEHVVLRNQEKTLVVQPASKEPFTDTASSALRDMAYHGLVATFPLDAVRELRGPKGDREFFIVVVGEGTKEKEFKVKEKHFERLP